MLVLSRFRGESIRIGDDVIVKVFRVRGSEVLVGIEAPREIVVLRAEAQRRPPQCKADDAPAPQAAGVSPGTPHSS